MLHRIASRAARLPPRPLRRLSSEKTYAVPGRVLQDIPKARPEKGWPWYLKALGASAACAGTGAYIALLMHHELGFRRFCESISPSLVDLVRQRYPFADEDPERRAYVKQLEAELAIPRTVSFNGRRVEVDGEASASECREALGIACDLDIDVEDVEGVDEVMVAEEAVRRPSQLEIAVARCGASVWAPLPPQIPTEGPTAQIEELEARKRKIGDDLASGVLRVDAAQPEVDAIESRLRELRKK